MKSNWGKVNQEIEKLRQAIAAPEFKLDASKIGICFCNPFFSSMAFLESTEPLENTELLDSIIITFLKTLGKIGDECRMNMINSVLQSPNEEDAKQGLDKPAREDRVTKTLTGQGGHTSKSNTHTILLQVPGTDFVHGYMGNREISSVVHYFLKNNIGIINTSFQEKEMYTLRFSIPEERKQIEMLTP